MDKNTIVNGNVYGVANAEDGANIHQNIILPEHKTQTQLTVKLGTDTIIGRVKELQEIDTLLNESNSLLLINGIGGIGKSTIASYYLHSQKDKLDYYGFFEGLDSFTVELREPLALQQEKENDAFMEALAKLRNLKGNKLLVFYDVKEINKNQDKIEKILALKDSGYKILLTSREEIEDVEQYYLDVLSLPDAKELFNSIYKVEDEVLLEEILEYLDCHAFFVEMTAKTLKSKKTLTPQIIKEKFENGEFSTIQRKRKESFNDYLNELFSFDELDNEEILMLKQLSVLPSIEIEFEELEYILNMTKQNNNEELIHFQKKDSENFEEVLQYISEKGWISSIDNSYKLHQIVKEYILSFHRPIFEEIEIVLDIYQVYLNGVTDIKIAMSLKNKIKYFEALSKVLKLLHTENENVAHFFARVGLIYQHMDNYKKAEPIYLRVLDIHKKIFGETHLYTARAYNNLATLYMDMGLYKNVESLYLKSLGIREEIYGVSHPETINLYINLAELYQIEGQYKQSEALYLKALSILDNSDLNKAIAYNNLAELYRAEGKYGRAEPLYKKAIRIRKELQSLNHPDIATNYNNLGLLYYTIKHYKKAKPLYEKALRIREEVLGVNHPTTATSYNTLALLYEALGNNKKAEIFYLKDLRINEERLGLYHPTTAESYYNFGSFLYDTNSFKKAFSYISKSIEIWEKFFPQNHANLINANQWLNKIEEKLNTKVAFSKIARNASCPCKSGKKYKKCCGKNN